MTIVLPGKPFDPRFMPKPAVDPVYQALVERARAQAARDLIPTLPAPSGDQGEDK